MKTKKMTAVILSAVMLASLPSCGKANKRLQREEKETKTTAFEETEEETEAETETPETEVETETAEAEPETEESTEEIAEETEPSKANGIRPEFQEAMDEYLAFFEEYCDFLKKYASSDNPALLIGEYTSYMTQYAETMEAFDKLEEEEMSDEEVKLYIDTNAEIQKMLLEVM